MQIAANRLLPTLVPAVNLANIYQYHRTWKKVIARRNAFTKQQAACIKVVTDYCEISEYEDLRQLIKSLRQEIRNATKGTAIRESQDAITDDLVISTGTEQLYNANLTLLKAAYRAVATLTHPDKGGDADLFSLVTAAYRNKDLIFLRELYFKLTSRNNWIWQQADGIAYAEQELERVHVSEQILKDEIIYRIYYHHVVNKKGEAATLAGTYLQLKAIALNNELQSIFQQSLTEGAYHGQEGKRSQSEEEIQSSGEGNEEGEDRYEGFC